MADYKAKARDFYLLIFYIAFVYITLPIAPAISNSLSRLLGPYFRVAVDIAVILPVFSLPFILLRRKPRAFKPGDESAGCCGENRNVKWFSASEDSAKRRMEAPAFRPGSFIFYRRLCGRSIFAYFGLLAVFSAYVMLLKYYTPITAEKVHLLEYGLLSYLAMRMACGIESRSRRYLYAAAIIILVGYGDESIQRVLPNRVWDLRDVNLNILGGFLGLMLMSIFGYGDKVADQVP